MAALATAEREPVNAIAFPEPKDDESTEDYFYRVFDESKELHYRFGLALVNWTIENKRPDFLSSNLDSIFGHQLGQGFANIFRLFLDRYSPPADPRIKKPWPASLPGESVEAYLERVLGCCYVPATNLLDAIFAGDEDDDDAVAV